ncbi:hypothetical protein PPYR_04244 [Photinus pyralis]|uniref:CCHamide-1 n=1 Tax=Photinus pyralis TaxID=7054 RepID=A0A5N4AXT5_PHOPY|nr:uncharacterized protein LOC116162874 [Photinus pyralis]XP_031332482.1 uncharacterized protein LOC116162874 [Photinus pyralis]KAB0802058.1 hypothetical protein PPYR_04244 [Photinus pyralis]
MIIMCQLLKLKYTAMTGKVAAISVILIFCFAECAAGSCLSYGHSCWGGHGKRSDTSNGDTKDSSVDSISDTKWALSRLLQPSFDVRKWKAQNDVAVPKHSNLENIKSALQDDIDSDTLDTMAINDDSLYVDEQPSSRHRTAEDRMRLYKLIKNINRLN